MIIIQYRYLSFLSKHLLSRLLPHFSSSLSIFFHHHLRFPSANFHTFFCSIHHISHSNLSQLLRFHTTLFQSSRFLHYTAVARTSLPYCIAGGFVGLVQLIHHPDRIDCTQTPSSHRFPSANNNFSTLPITLKLHRRLFCIQGFLSSTGTWSVERRFWRDCHLPALHT